MPGGEVGEGVVDDGVGALALVRGCDSGRAGGVVDGAVELCLPGDVPVDVRGGDAGVYELVTSTVVVGGGVEAGFGECGSTGLEGVRGGGDGVPFAGREGAIVGAGVAVCSEGVGLATRDEPDVVDGLASQTVNTRDARVDGKVPVLIR